MPKAIANCVCRVCGKEFQKELFKSGKGACSRLAEKVEWAESGGIDLCAECWKANRRAEEIAAGLTCEIRLGDVLEENAAVWAVFGGDTLSHKDALKAAGCRWTENYPTGNVLGDMIGLGCPRKAWAMSGSLEDADMVVQAAKNLGAAVTYPDNMTLREWAAFRAETLKIREEEKQKQEAKATARKAEIAAKLEELGPKPQWPERILSVWPDGGKWNGKVYGRSGRHTVYLGGVKVEISDSEAAEMETTLNARREWEKRKKEIETA